MDVLASVWVVWLMPVFLLLVGFGAVIFFHELGHFLVAKLVGIKIERFAIGFGPRVLGLKLGETDYCICALPLGGYVKMLGQEDFKPLEEGQQADPRSYNAKSVGARFAVISAGVIMNVIMAGVLFVVVGLVGKDFPTSVIGGTSAGMPANLAKIQWQDQQAKQANLKDTLQPGDRITKIQGDSVILWVTGGKITNLSEVMMTSLLSSPNDMFEFTIQRQVGDKSHIGKADIGVFQGKTLMFGIQQAHDIVFNEAKDIITDSPFKKNDRLISADGAKIKDFLSLNQIDRELTGKPVKVVVEREDENVEVEITPTLRHADNVFWLKDGPKLKGKVVGIFKKDVKQEDDSTETVKKIAFSIEIADGTIKDVLKDDLISALRILGMEPRLKISSVIEKSPANKAGLLPGDIILLYGDRSTPTLRQFFEISENVEDKKTNIIVLRGNQQKSFGITPTKHGKDVIVGISNTLDFEHPVLGYIQEGSVADEAGIKKGATITAINGIEVNSWIDIYNALTSQAGKEVSIEYQLGIRTETASLGVLDSSKFEPTDYSFSLFSDNAFFKPLMVKIVQPNALAALKWGGKETIKLVLGTYASLRSLISGYASTDTLMGPVGIAGTAITVGRERPLIDFVYFMGLISVALAVFNFLPLPVFDGGHAVLLIIEKIRGKPLSVKLLNIIQAIGLGLILILVVLVTWQDIARIIKGLW